MHSIKNNRGRTALATSALLTVLAAASPLQAKQRIEQLSEDSATTRVLPAQTQKSVLSAASSSRVCEAGAKWIRLGFKSLVLKSYDSLVITSSGGDRYVFQGAHWNDRAFHARALRGSCVDIQPYFASPQSGYQVGSFDFGTTSLARATVTVAGAGDICDSTGASTCQATSDLIMSISPTAVFTAGDNVYSNGTLSEYNARYAPTWGRFKTLTKPTPGNHDYNTSGATGYYDYFGALAGDRSKGYYSWDVGDWHFVALNTMSGGTVSDTQVNWLKSDLAANTKPCTAAYFHHPLVSRGNYTGNSTVKPFWDALYAAKADLVLVGHDHNYQRYGKMNPSQVAAADGIRQVLVGTGGRSFYSLSGSHALLQASNANTHGVLKLTLTATGYTGDFVPRAGSSYTDTFSGTCNKAGSGGNVAPVANFSSTTSGLTAAFTDTSTDSDGTIASRSWAFGDGTTSTAANPSKTYAAAGTYTVTLTVTDNGGTSNTKSSQVTVSSATNAAPVANFTSTTSALTASFTDSSTDSDGTIASRSWDFGNGVSSTSTNPSHTYAAAGTYTVTLTVTDNAGATNTKTASVTVTAPVANVLTNGVAVTGITLASSATRTWTMVVPAGATNLKFATTGGTGDADLYVRFGSAPTTTTNDCKSETSTSTETCNIATAQAGTYYVMVLAYNAISGVNLTGSYTAPGANVAPTANFTVATSGLTASFTDSSTDSDGTIASRSWNFGNGVSSTLTNPSHTYAAAGTYTVTLTVTDNGGLTHSKTSTVTVSGGSGGTVLTSGVAVALPSGTSGTFSPAYTLVVPSGKTSVTFALSGGSGDADMYVNLGSALTTPVSAAVNTATRCVPYMNGNAETCTFNAPTAGTYYVTVRAYATYSGVSLKGTVSP